MASAGAVKARAMQSSSSEESYAQYSSIQNQGFHKMAKPVLAKAVEQLVCNIAARSGSGGGEDLAQGRKHIAIADLGCSYGRNTLDCAEFILGALQNWAIPEIQYFFSDLPSNDFNALFESLHPYLHQPPNIAASHVNRPPSLPRMYVAGVPGSFHGRLFPSASLDLVTCSYALHWLSQVPPSIVDKSSPAWNGGHSWIPKASQNVLDAYVLQSQMDLGNFLKSRACELARGGILFMLIPNNQSLNYKSPIWELFDSAWKEMVNEGIISIEEWNTFNLPIHFFNVRELENMLTEFFEFKVLHMENMENKSRYTLHQMLQHLVSATKSIVETHLGKQKSEELFAKLKVIASKKFGLETSYESRNLVVASLQRL